MPLPRDPYLTSSVFTQAQPGMKLRAGTVSSVQDDRTVTVTVAGDTTAIAGVRYLGDMAPLPGAMVMLMADGADLFALGHMAAADRTLSPRANRSTTQSIADATDTAVSFDAVNSDAWGCWDAGNAARLTAPLTGRYMAVGNVHFAGNATGVRTAWIEKTGTSTLGRVQVLSAGAGLPTWLNVTTPPFDMTAGTDYVRLIVRQNSGGALDLQQSSTFSPALALVYLGA